MKVEFEMLETLKHNLTICPVCLVKPIHGNQFGSYYHCSESDHFDLIFWTFQNEIVRGAAHSCKYYNNIYYCTSEIQIFFKIAELCLENAGKELAEKINQKMKVWQVFS